MARMVRNLLTVVLISGMMTAIVAQAGQAHKRAGQSRQAAGAVTFAGTVAAPPSGAGVTWGKGTLILNDGTQHAFEVSGLGITSTREAIVSLQAVGEVYNLKKLSDFEGTYKATQQQVTAGREAEAVSLANERGVIVSMSVKAPATASAVSLTPSPTGITVTLDK
jgi:hypothetical protein